MEKTCSKCERRLPLTDFPKRANGADGHRGTCKECSEQWTKRWREANPERVQQAQQERYQANRDALLEENRRYRQANREKLAADASARHKATKREHSDAVLDHYGRECACCGGTERLEIDHMDGSGAAHRAEIGSGSTTLHRWLVENGFPAGFQTLCHRCNSSKGRGQQCKVHRHAA
jgi:hypothetical protein